MSIAKKLAHKAEAVKGGAKKRVGRLTGNRRLRAEGRSDQAKGTPNRPVRKSRTPSGTDDPHAPSRTCCCKPLWSAHQPRPSPRCIIRLGLPRTKEFSVHQRALDLERQRAALEQVPSLPSAADLYS
jgi:uncharacterized protein YjbJ (UPF0337 family)